MSTADIIERRWLGDWDTPNDAQRDIAAALNARGANFARMSFHEATNMIIGEGWFVQPDDQGDLPI